MSENLEKRKAERKMLRQNAQLELQGGQWVAIRTRDIGVTGMGLLSETNFKAGQACAVKVVLNLPGQQRHQLYLKAKVAHSIFSQSTGGFQIGIAFQGLAEDAVKTIQDFIHSPL